MIWFLYNLIFFVVFLLLLPRFIVRMLKRGGYRQGFLQRLGYYAPAVRERLGAGPRVWIHAVSVGEVQVALRFMSALRERRSALRFILTTTTSTGHAIAVSRLSTEDVLLYFPVDFPWIMARVLNVLRPLALVLVEGEFWPNLLRLARRRGVPIMLLNGRLSDHSYRGYRKVKCLMKKALECFELFCLPGPEEGKRLIELGASPEKIRIFPSAKYDVQESSPPDLGAAGAFLRRAGFEADARWLIGGSTWPGEEAILLEIYKKLRAQDPKARLALIPRHAERRRAVMAEIRKAGLTSATWSALKAGRAHSAPGAEVLLVDTTGEIKPFYALATVIFVGKSLTAHGGQNIIEAAVFAKPIVVGPYTENFTTIVADFRAADALIQVPDAAALERSMLKLWINEQAAQTYGQRAEQLVRSKAGAIRASAECLLTLLDSGKQSL